MDWTLWILSSAVFLALYDLAKKESVRDNAVLPTLFFSTLFGAAGFALCLALRGGFAAAWRAGTETVLFGLSKSLLVGASWVMTYQALRTLPITIATPIRASSPALVFALALVLYGECPSALQGCGMALVFAGYWVFSWAGRHEGIDFRHSRAVWFAIGGAVLSALSALWDKYILQVRGLSVEGVQLWFQLGLVVTYAALGGVAHAAGLRQRFEWRKAIPFVGLLLALADWLYFTGLAQPDVPISVAALLRRVSVVITFAAGAVFFHERNLVRKAIATAVILAGAALLVLG